MILYHGTTRILKVGDPVVADVAVSQYPEVVAELENKRALHLPSRSICVFAANTITAAHAYVKGQTDGLYGLLMGNDQLSIRIYEVEMEHSHAAPFCLVHEMRNRLKAGRGIDNLIAEYWKPQVEWNFLEYFGPSFVVRGEVLCPTYPDQLRFDTAYSADKERAKAI